MTISDRIFERLNELSMTQKEFSEKTSIRQSTISEWKKKHTNPSADKIMIICSVLNVEPEWLLSGAEVKKGHKYPVDWYVIDRGSELGVLVSAYNEMDTGLRARLMGSLTSYVF